MRVINKNYIQKILDDVVEEQREINESQKEINLDRKVLGRSLKSLNQLSVSCHLILDIINNGTK